MQIHLNKNDTLELLVGDESQPLVLKVRDVKDDRIEIDVVSTATIALILEPLNGGDLIASIKETIEQFAKSEPEGRWNIKEGMWVHKGPQDEWPTGDEEDDVHPNDTIRESNIRDRHNAGLKCGIVDYETFFTWVMESDKVYVQRQVGKRKFDQPNFAEDMGASDVRFSMEFTDGNVIELSEDDYNESAGDFVFELVDTDDPQEYIWNLWRDEEDDIPPLHEEPKKMKPRKAKALKAEKEPVTTITDNRATYSAGPDAFMKHHTLGDVMYVQTHARRPGKYQKGTLVDVDDNGQLSIQWSNKKINNTFNVDDFTYLTDTFVVTDGSAVWYCNMVSVKNDEFIEPSELASA